MYTYVLSLGIYYICMGVWIAENYVQHVADVYIILHIKGAGALFVLHILKKKTKTLGWELQHFKKSTLEFSEIRFG